MSTYYIGADVHSNSTELAIENRGKIVARYSVPTSIPAITNVLDMFQGKKYIAVEEGPMSGWLYRNLATKTIKLTPPNSLFCCEAVFSARFIKAMMPVVLN